MASKRVKARKKIEKMKWDSLQKKSWKCSRKERLFCSWMQMQKLD